MTEDNLINHPEFERLFNIPTKYYSYWLNKYKYTFDSSDVLDFGCGYGYATVGISKFCNANKVVGVDIGQDYLKLNSLPDAPIIDIPDNVTFKNILPGVDLGSNLYDIAVSWSVLEHVSQDIFNLQLKKIYNSLKPGGCFIFQVAPLYYSPYGSHFHNLQKPWAHLETQTSIMKQQIESKLGGAENAVDHWNCFITLNKYQKQDFIDSAISTGFELLELYETPTKETPSERLLNIYTREALMLEQILAIMRKS
jgi:SAM-dependent methyltransferase